MTILDPSSTAIVEHLLASKDFAAEHGGGFRVQREDGTLFYRMAWVKNGRALYVYTGKIQGKGDVRI